MKRTSASTRLRAIADILLACFVEGVLLNGKHFRRGRAKSGVPGFASVTRPWICLVLAAAKYVGFAAA
jgi:hypothetical protein